MYRKIAFIGATAVAIVGVGTAALATTGSGASASPTSASSSGSSSSGSSSAAGGKAGKFLKKHPLLGKALAHHAVHGTVVTKDGSKYVAHDGILGTVTAVSATSISIKSSDGYAQTFAVGSGTTVRVRKDGSGSKATIAAVHTGDSVGVAGTTSDSSTSSSTPTAKVIVDVQKS